MSEEQQTTAAGYRIFWDYAWNAEEAISGYRWFLERDGKFLRDRHGRRVGFRDTWEAEAYLAQQPRAGAGAEGGGG